MKKKPRICRSCGHEFTDKEAIIVTMLGRTFLACPKCGYTSKRR